MFLKCYKAKKHMLFFKYYEEHHQILFQCIKTNYYNRFLELIVNSMHNNIPFRIASHNEELIVYKESLIFRYELL